MLKVGGHHCINGFDSPLGPWRASSRNRVLDDGVVTKWSGLTMQSRQSKAILFIGNLFKKFRYFKRRFPFFSMFNGVLKNRCSILFYLEWYSITPFVTPIGVDGPAVENFIVFWNFWPVCNWSGWRRRAIQEARRGSNEIGKLFSSVGLCCGSLLPGDLGR